MTFLQHIQQECGGEYPLRQILDNLEDNQIIDSINNYVKTLKNMESSSRIIHRQPTHGFYYWVKFNHDTDYEVAYCYRYEDNTMEFQPTNGESAYTTDVSDWKKQPLIFNEAHYG